MRWSRTNLIWLAAYLVSLALIVWANIRVREITLATMSRPEAQADWDAWRQAAAEQSKAGPVRRRVPASREPPALVLERDYFPVVLGGSLLFGSALFFSITFAARGAFGRATPLPSQAQSASAHK
jgi:hypothetical protein